jgi:hypothetical protein
MGSIFQVHHDIGAGFALPSSVFKGFQPYQYLIYPYLLLQVWFDVHFFDHD